MHISNRYLELGPVVAAGAAALGHPAELVINYESEEPGDYCFTSRWVLVGAPAALFDWPEVQGHLPQPPTPGFVPWTDDYSNVLSVLRTR